MSLLLDQDYAELQERGISTLEDEANRFLVFPGFELPQGIYMQPSCDVLVAVPRNYNQDGNDMFWTYPRLTRADGAPIPATGEPGADSRTFQSRIFCRWSRHWHKGSSIWRPGSDNVVTIMRRITWAFEHPDAK